MCVYVCLYACIWSVEAVQNALPHSTVHHVPVCIYVYVYVCMYACIWSIEAAHEAWPHYVVHISMYMYVCMYVCMHHGLTLRFIMFQYAYMCICSYMSLRTLIHIKTNKIPTIHTYIHLLT
jgi:hypothetical protein